MQPRFPFRREKHDIIDICHHDTVVYQRVNDMIISNINPTMRYTTAILVQQKIPWLYLIHGNFCAISFYHFEEPFFTMVQMPLIGIRGDLDGPTLDVSRSFEAGDEQHATINALTLDFRLIYVRGPKPCVGFFYDRIHSNTSFNGTNGAMTDAESSSVLDDTVPPLLAYVPCG
uniref:Uncharacterized protein n=1 Tax=Siphoviridae sp. ctgu013 TaxID=2826421 RepID=A0A8S5NH56_9CAUD|nr:MAG TPA: hypothetical protein [Siphoviridae sp. ctgu013]